MSETSMRLRMVVEEHDQLLMLVARRRNELDRVEQEIRAAVTRVAGHMGPLAEEAQRLDEAIHRMLEALASAKQRARRERNQIRRVHRDLQRMGVISPRETAATGNAPDFGEFAEDDGRCRCHDDQAGFLAPEIVAVNQTEQGALRDLFRRLADALHPDKVQDEQDKAIRTEVMKEITVAYRERDFARLVEIERTWAAAPVDDDDRGDEVERRIAVLVKTNLELRKQVRGLERELRRLRNSQPGQLSRDLKRSDRAGGGVAGVVGPVEEDLQELRRVHDHVQAFQEGKIGLPEFLEGPADPDDEVDESVIFGEMLSEFLTLMHEEVAPRRGGRGGRGKKARPKQERRRA
jgi:hypothetical protein